MPISRPQETAMAGIWVANVIVSPAACMQRSRRPTDQDPDIGATFLTVKIVQIFVEHGPSGHRLVCFFAKFSLSLISRRGQCTDRGLTWRSAHRCRVRLGWQLGAKQGQMPQSTGRGLDAFPVYT